MHRWTMYSFLPKTSGIIIKKKSIMKVNNAIHWMQKINKLGLKHNYNHTSSEARLRQAS